MSRLVTALTLHQAGRAPDAAAAYQEILADEPDNPDALYLLGILARQTRNTDDAIRLIEGAIAVKPGVPQYYNHLGECFVDAGEADRGKKSFLHALQINPRYVEAMVNLAGILARTGQYREAAMCYAAALRIRPDDRDCLRQLKALSNEL
jgi:tetratricopeptide (TPR) repeat protein